MEDCVRRVLQREVGVEAVGDALGVCADASSAVRGGGVVRQAVEIMVRGAVRRGEVMLAATHLGAGKRRLRIKEDRALLSTRAASRQLFLRSARTASAAAPPTDEPSESTGPTRRAVTVASYFAAQHSALQHPGLPCLVCAAGGGGTTQSGPCAPPAAHSPHTRTGDLGEIEAD